MPLPEEGAPVDFGGSVGDFQFNLHASPTEVKVGDPITLRLTITGEGNFKTVNFPALDFRADFKVYQPEVRQGESSKTFEQVIIPKNENIKQIPEVRFSFFDTRAAKYRSITRGPIPIQVTPLPKEDRLRVFTAPEEGTGGIRRSEILGRDIIYIKDSPGRLKPRNEFLCRNKLYIAAWLIPLLAIISVLILQKRRERLEADISYARRLVAPRKAKRNLLKLRRLLDSREPVRFFDAVFKALQEYLGDKFHLSTAGITSDIVRELSQRNIERATLDKLSRCFSDCDTARFAPSEITGEQMLKTLNLLREVIQELEKVRI